jgi:DNA invertase Pin-like site-specific DNA recombinase/regulator of replication initiation timing
MAICYSYCRFSSKKQELSMSIERQEGMLKKWLTAHPEHTLSLKRLRDDAISSFHGKNIRAGDLGKFIAHVKAGEIEIGSILVIESLDRFSRLPPRQSLNYFNELINAGIVIQTLLPEMTITADNIDNNNMLYPVICMLDRAHDESRIKAHRVSAYWEKIRAEKIIDKGHLPAWLEVKDGKIVPKKDVIKAIKFIFSKTIDGMGLTTLVRELNANFPTYAKGKRKNKWWNSTYVRTIVNNRVVLGEMQFYKRDGKDKRVPIGDPVPNYYPAVIDESIWLQAQASKKSRSSRKGRRADDFFNLFSGLVTMGDNYPAHIQTIHAHRRNGKHHIARRWHSYGHRQYGHRQRKKDACKMSYDYYRFEEMALQALWQIKTEQLFPAKTKDNRLEKKNAELIGLDLRIKELASAIGKMKKPIPQIIEQVAILDQRRDKLREEITTLKTHRETAKSKPLAETKTLIEIMRDNPSLEIRQRLRSLLAILIKSITIKPFKSEKKNFALIDITFNQHEYVLHLDTRLIEDKKSGGWWLSNVQELEASRKQLASKIGRKELRKREKEGTIKYAYPTGKTKKGLIKAIKIRS